MFQLSSQKRMFAEPQVSFKKDRQGFLTSVTIPEGMMLVTAEDIYTRGEEPVLLLRAAQPVDPGILEKLIRHGARPEQLVLKKIPSVSALEERFSQKPRVQGRVAGTSPMTSPSEEPSWSPPVSRDNMPADHGYPLHAASHKVMVMDPDQKSLKRLSHCLMSCGIKISDIHSVRLSDHCLWSARKYQPSTVFLSCSLEALENGQIPAVIRDLRQLPCVQRIILLSEPIGSDPLDWEMFQAWAESLNCPLVPKPVTRFTVLPHLRSPQQHGFQEPREAKGR